MTPITVRQPLIVKLHKSTESDNNGRYIVRALAHKDFLHNIVHSIPRELIKVLRVLLSLKNRFDNLLIVQFVKNPITCKYKSLKLYYGEKIIKYAKICTIYKFIILYNFFFEII